MCYKPFVLSVRILLPKTLLLAQGLQKTSSSSHKKTVRSAVFLPSIFLLNYIKLSENV